MKGDYLLIQVINKWTWGGSVSALAIGTPILSCVSFYSDKNLASIESVVGVYLPSLDNWPAYITRKHVRLMGNIHMRLGTARHNYRSTPFSNVSTRTPCTSDSLTFHQSTPFWFERSFTSDFLLVGREPWGPPTILMSLVIFLTSKDKRD